MAQVIIDYQEYQDLLERVERLKDEVQMLNASRETTYRTLKEELDGKEAENARLKKELVQELEKQRIQAKWAEK